MKKDSQSSEIIKILSDQYPKFSKVQLCMVRNPEYGIQLNPEAERKLKEAGYELKKKYSTPPPRPKRPKPKSPPKKRVSVRLSDEEYEKLRSAAKNSGCQTMQQYLEVMLNIKNVQK